jgi:Bacteriophage T7 DNA helicase/primase, N-terminal a+b fold/DnaB-like helicase C terminal domain/Toprim-like
VSDFAQHEPCPSCGSQDNLARYDDGHGYCFGCGYYEHGEGTTDVEPKEKIHSASLCSGEFRALKLRGITEETCRALDYQTGTYKGEPVQIANYHDAHGTRVAQKLRFANKEFIWLGEPKRALLFGQHKWGSPMRRIVVTEGEIDALSVSQAQGNKWPVVSVPSGSKGAAGALSKQLEWLDRFEQVVLFFDQDEAGQAAALECAELFAPGKACIVLGFSWKDANDALRAGEVAAIIKAQWNATPYWPDDLIAGESEELWEKIVSAPANAVYRYPWPGLNDKTFGQRPGEIVLWTAGSGIGKSSLLREVVYYCLPTLRNRGEKVGIVALEENVRRTALGLMSLHVNKPLHLNHILTTEKLREAFDASVGSGAVLLYDHWGSLESKRLLSKVRAMVRAGCKIVVLDHISIVISGSDEADSGERRAIDKMMTSLRSLAEELQFTLHVVSHLRKQQQGKRSHEEGGRVTLDDLRGSGALKQLSDIVIAAERNQQADDLSERHQLLLRVLKNRFAGITGIACQLEYDPETGRIKDNDNPFKEEKCEPASDF